MLKMISWASYAQALSGGLILYYGWWFWRYAGGRKRPSPRSDQSFPQPPSPELAPPTPESDARLQSLVMLTSEITHGVQQASLAQQSPQALFAYLQQVLQRYPELKSEPFQRFIYGVINEAYQRIGFIPLNATEQANLWEAI